MAGVVTVDRNLCPNPAFANDIVGWSSSSGTYARSTSIAAGLPRTVGFEGTGTGTIDSVRSLVTAGFSYVLSVSINPLAAQNIDMYVKFYNGTTGGTFISQTATSSYIIASGVPTRIVLGPFVAPAGALSMQVKIAGIDAGGIELTGMRVAPYSGDVVADSAYLDGATPGATWDGTAGSSTSTRRSVADFITFQETFSKTVTANPNSKVHLDTATLTEAIAVAASGPVVDAFQVVDGFLVASLSFDPDRGRVRLNAYTFAMGVTHARVSRRLVGGRYEVIRGGDVPIFNGAFSRIVDDFEYPAGVDVEYLIEGLTDTDVVVQRAVVRRSGARDVAWIKSVANPRLNVKARVVGWSEITRKSRNGIFEVINRYEPVVTSDVFSAYEFTIQVLTRSRSETEALDRALRPGFPIYFQMTADVDLPSIYASVGTFTRKPPKKLNSGHQLFSIPLIEVSKPPPTIIGSVTSYAFVLEDNGTYNDLLDVYDSYDELAA